MKIEKEIGVGNDCIYVYFNENDKKLAFLENRDRWECKIGYSSNSVVERILSQEVHTAMAREPVVGLLIRTSNGYYVESFLHKSLYQYKVDRNSKLLGDEWFLTNPKEVENIFLNNTSPPSINSKKYVEYVIGNIESLGIALNSHRKKLKLTNDVISELVGVGRNTLYRMFRGNEVVSIGTVFKVLKVLRLKIVLTSDIETDNVSQINR